MCGFGVPYGTGASGRIARRLILLGVYFVAVGTMGTLEQPHFGHAADNAKVPQATSRTSARKRACSIDPLKVFSEFLESTIL